MLKMSIINTSLLQSYIPAAFITPQNQYSEKTSISAMPSRLNELNTADSVSEIGIILNGI